MKRMHNLLAAALAVVLLAALSAVSLARPERTALEDRFVGLFIVQEAISSGGTEVDRSQWEVYDTVETNLGNGIQFQENRYRLMGQKQPDGGYLFPGMEGYALFLVWDTGPNGERSVGSVSDLAETKMNIHEDDTANLSTHSLSGVLYSGPPLDDSSWNTHDFDYCWTPYPVYQTRDGAIYITDQHAAASYGGVGGFTVTLDREYTERANGKVVRQTAVEIQFELRSIPRPETLTWRQYDGEGRLLSQNVLSAQSMAPGQDAIHWPLASGGAYAVLEVSNADGTITRTIHDFPNGQAPSPTVWLLDDTGAGYPVTIHLEP